MDKLIRHIEAAQSDADALEREGNPLGRIRRRDENFLRKVLLGFAPWPAAFGPENRKC